MLSALEIRAQINSFRSNLSSDEIRDRSEKICANLLQLFKSQGLLPDQKGAAASPPTHWIALYCALKGEPELDIARDEIQWRGEFSIAWPRSVPGLSRGEMEMAGTPTDGTQWVSDRFGFQTPGPHCAAVPPRFLAAVVVPSLALTRQGHRMGRKAGFYDRYLPRAPQAWRVGVAFHEQMLDEIPQNSWDVPMDAWVTDLGSSIIRSRESCLQDISRQI